MRVTTCRGMEGKKLQQGIFPRRQVNQLAAAPDVPAGRVDLQVVDLQDRRFDLVPAPHQRPHPGEQLLQLKGLGQVIIGPQVEAANLVFQGSASREHQHMDLEFIAPPSLQQTQAVDLRQHQVEDHHVVAGRSSLEIALFSIFRNINREPLFFESLPKSFGE